MEQNYTACVFIAEKRDSFIYPLLQITEADYVAECLYAVEYSVCAAECLNQAVHSQILINPECVECGGIKARKKHIYYYEQIKLLVFHAERNIFVVILKSVAVGAVICVEHLVVILDCIIKEITGCLVKCGCVFAVFFVKYSVGFCLICAVTEYGCYFELLCRVGSHLLFEFFIIEFCRFCG